MQRMCIVWRASTPRECHDVLSFSLSRRQPSGEEQQSSGAMAKLQPLKLSDLRSGVDYPVGTDVQERRCLFHVKLTDFSMKSIESLINSDKVSASHRKQCALFRVATVARRCSTHLTVFPFFRVRSFHCGLEMEEG